MTSPPPRVSVCIPAYNEERSIARCLESVLHQRGCELDEILVGVNSSTDRTRSIVEAHHRRDARVRVVESPKGKANAWNALNREARNTLRFFQDGDCFVHPDTYRAMLAEYDEALDILGASLERDVDGTGPIVRIMNFPRRYVTPAPELNGGLYLLNYERVSRALHRHGLARMPETILNDDQLLHWICTSVKVSAHAFVVSTPASSVTEEIRRHVRMEAGREDLRARFPSERARMEADDWRRGTLYRWLYGFRSATLTEKVLYPVVTPLKFLIFRYVSWQAHRTTEGRGVVSWK